MQAEGELHVICLLSEELPERLKLKIQLIGEGRTCYSFVNLQGKLQHIYIDQKYTEAASYRLFEASMDFQLDHLKTIGCNPNEYINSGFLIMNLELMRKDNMVEKFIEASKVDYLEFPDQDVLNQLCKDRILALPPYYNSIRTFYLPQYKKFFLQKYTEQDWLEVHRHGTVHYTGAKPWNQFTVQFQLWWQYYEQLPEIIKKEWQVDKKIYFLSKLYRTSCGTFVVDKLQALYRKMKY